MKKITLSLLILIITSLSSFSQTPINEFTCSTEWTSLNEIASNKKQSKNRHESRFTNIESIPTKVHVVRESDGNGGYTEASINSILDILNEAYLPMEMSFDLYQGINYIDNTELYNTFNEDNIANPTEVIQVLNIYFVPQGIAYAYFPNPLDQWTSETDRIFLSHHGVDSTIDNDYLNYLIGLSGKTLIHEMGHTFSLIHTHGTSNTELTDELVDGSNCSTAGDKICDTPAEPILHGLVELPNCNYTGTETDANGDLFAPLTNNHMSYSLKYCINSFTEEQQEAIVETLYDERIYLLNNLNIENFAFDNTIKLFPNPTKNHITIQGNTNITNASLYNIQGQKIDVKLINNKINLENKPSGVYFLQLISEQGSVTKKIIKE